jgi:protein-tyrosine phosphatase
MMEAVFTHLVNQAGLSAHFEIDSAGTHDYHVGETADPRTLRMLTAHNISYSGRAREITRADLEKFDYILAAEQSHVAEIRALGAPRGTLARMLDYAPAQPLRDFPDPYYTGQFEQTYTLAVQAAQGLLDQLKPK